MVRSLVILKEEKDKKSESTRMKADRYPDGFIFNIEGKVAKKKTA